MKVPHGFIGDGIGMEAGAASDTVASRGETDSTAPAEEPEDPACVDYSSYRCVPGASNRRQ